MITENNDPETWQLLYSSGYNTSEKRHAIFFKNQPLSELVSDNRLID